MGQQRSNRFPLRSWLLAAVGAAVLGVLIDSAGLLYHYQGGRPRDTGWAWVFQLIVLLVAPHVLGLLPGTFSRYYDFSAFTESLRFLGASVLLNAVLAGAVALLAVGLARLFRRRAARQAAATVWEWRPASLLAVWLLFLAPTIVHFACEMSMVGLARLSYASQVAVGVVVVGLLWLLLRWPVARLKWFGALSKAVAAGLAGLALLAVLAGGAAGILAGAPEPPPPPEGRKPDILLISIDSLRADHLHSYGYQRETSPHIDALAREGVMFRHTVAPTSWTLPSHVTMLTSLPPNYHKVTADLTRLDPQAVTLAEVLRNAGYTTAAFVSGAYLRAEYGHRQGFEHFDDYSALPLAWNAHRQITSPDLVRVVTRWIEDWDRGGRERPFFIFLHMWDVHYDYNPPSPYDRMFDPDYTGSITSENFEGNRAINPKMDPRDLEHIVALYDGEIRYTDEYLGRLFDFLRERGLFDETLVTVTADHGDEFFEHGKKGHRRTLYDEVLLVPLIMRLPGRIPAGKVVTEQVRLLDVAPTLLALAGVQPPESFGLTRLDPDYAGRNLSVYWREPKPPPAPPAYGQLSYQLGSVRTNDWKLIVHLTGDPRPELYNLRADPGERDNLSGEQTALLDDLYHRLMAFRRAGEEESLAEPVVMAREHLEALRSLGYVTDFVQKHVRASAELVAPPPGSLLTDSTVQFRWKGEEGIEQYYLKVGHSVDAEDIFGRDAGRRTAVTVNRVPLDGRKLYVRLFWRLGEKWYHEDYEYLTPAAGTEVSEGGVRIVKPPPGTKLEGPRVTFAWTPGENVSLYLLKVGSAPNATDIYAGNADGATSATVTGIPQDARAIFVRLLWRVDNAWKHRDFVYQAAGFAPARPEMLEPAPGAALPGGKCRFEWSRAAGAEQYYLAVGTAPQLADIYGKDQGLNRSATVEGLPRDGRKLYVRLSWRIGSEWRHRDYTYRAAGVEKSALVPSADSTR